MTKKELIDAVHDETRFTKSAIGDVLETLGKVARKAMKSGGEMTLPGIGVLSVKSRAARDGRNPRTGEPVHIPAKRVPDFRAAKALVDAANG